MENVCVAAENDDIDATIKTVEAEIASLEQNTDTLANDSEIRQKFVENSHTNYTKHLEEMKKNVNAIFDEVTREGLDRKQHYINKFNTDKQVCRSITEKLPGLKRTLKQTGDKQNRFMRVKRVREWTRDRHGEMKTILNATETEVFQDIPPVQVTRELKRVIGVNMAELTFYIRTKDDDKESGFVGICQIANGNIILADKANKCLKQLDTSYTGISRYTLPETANNVCAAGDSEVAVAMDNNKILIVAVGTACEKVRTIDLDHSCTNVAYHNEQVFITSYTPLCSYKRHNGTDWCCDCETTICMYNKSGNSLRSMTASIGEHHPSNCDNGTPMCVSADGEKIYVAHRAGLMVLGSEGGEITSSQDFPNIAGLCVDSKGFVYASKGGSNEVVKLSQEGTGEIKQIKTVTFSLDKTTTPGAFCYDKKLGRLVMCPKKGSYLYLEKHMHDR